MTSLTPAQMHVRLARYLPRDLATQVSPNAIAKCCQDAWDNGWRDPEWLANRALEGTGMANVTNPAALFMSQLQQAAAMECPEIETPTPRLPADYWRATDAAPVERVRSYVAQARMLTTTTTTDLVDHARGSGESTEDRTHMTATEETS